MPHNQEALMHSDAWWIRALEGDLSPSEARQWQAHLATCAPCRKTWQVMAQVDHLLRTAPPEPALSPAFTERTVSLAVRRQKLRRLLSFIAGLLIVALVGWFVLDAFNTTLVSVERTLSALISSRQILFASLMRILLGLVITWQTLAPFIVVTAGISLLLLAPNGILATLMVIWITRQRKALNPNT